MFTLHDKILRRAGGLFTALCAALAFCAGTAMDVHAQPAPPNDDLANAQGIIGISGSLTGTNVNATAEPGEPAPYPGNPAQASIWYLWTAPITTMIDFSTLGSTYPIGSPLQGEPLDTVLAVYKLKSGTNVAFTNMTQVASNEDDPSGGVTSRVDFPVTLGTLYLIQVDGSQAESPGTNAQGIIVLTWGPSLQAGTFGFSSSDYKAGQFDDGFLVQPPGSVSPSVHNAQGTNNVRITVARTGAFNGRCEVTLIVTNGYYTNIYETNYTGTNIYITNLDGLGNIIGITNIFFTNVASQNLVQNLGSGCSGGYLPVPGLYTVTQTNEYTVTNGITTPILDFGDDFGRAIINYPTLAGLGLQDFFTNFYCEPFSPQPVITGPTVITNSTMTNIVWTNVFCTTYVTNVVTPSASNGVDYQAFTQTLTFDDFQMSQDVYLLVNPSLGPDYPDANGNYTYIGINPKVILTLTNAVPDPYEDPNVVPPTISANLGSSELDILSLLTEPNNCGDNLHTNNSIYGTLGPDGGVSGVGLVTINWERATFRVNKNVGTAYIWAVLEGTPAVGATYTVSYTIDTTPPNFTLNAFEWNTFPLVADSDYAVPPVNGLPVNDFGEPLNPPGVPDGTSTWGGIDGTITIGPFPAFPAACIAIPINNNAATEFDSDIYLELFETSAQATANATQNPPGYLGNIVNANLTINFGGTPPGGAVDTTYNPDGTAASQPEPFNPTPGANATVQAVAMQANGEAVIGGSFTTYDSIPVYGIARVLSSGFLDTSFNNVPNGGGVNIYGYVSAIVIDSSQRIIIGGLFTSYDGNTPPTPNIARLNPDGSLDTTFYSGTGFNSFVTALAIDANSNILVGGDFTTYNTTNCNHIARLLPNGGLDPNFLPNTGNGRPNYGTDQDVQTVATDGNGNIILGGQFNFVNGATSYYLARLLTNGAVDPTFNPGIGLDGYVYSVAVEPNNEIIIGGAFQNFYSVSRNSVALISASGSLDASFNPGSGADGTVYSVLLQPDGNIVIGGQFRVFNTTRRLGVACLLPQGWIDTSFMDTGYNQFAGLINHYYNEPVRDGLCPCFGARHRQYHCWRRVRAAWGRR